MFKRDDIFCLDDIQMYKLERKGNFGNSEMYSNGEYTLLLDKIKHKEEPLYSIGFFYKNEVQQ